MIGNFSTERLSIRHWGSDLADPNRLRSLALALRPIVTNRVLEHLPPSLQLGAGENAIARWIAERDAQSDVFLVIKSQGDTVIGLLLMARAPEPELPEAIHVGYLFGQSDWGRGYATELLVGLVQAAKQSQAGRLIGAVAKDNPASARALLKAGFQRDETALSADMDAFVCDVS